MQDVLNFKANGPDYKFLNQVIENVKNIDNKTMLDIVREIYEATYYRYALLYHRAEGDRERMKDIVIKKTQKIEELQGLCSSLLNIVEHNLDVTDEDLNSLKKIYEEHKEEAAS